MMSIRHYAACAALLVASGAWAQATTTTTAPAAGTTATTPARADTKLSRGDVDFLKDAAQGGMAEVEAGKLAATKAVNTQVKGYADQMVKDHTKSGEELAALASSKGVTLPTEPSMAQKAKMKLLQGADGADFDKRYARSMAVEAHEDMLKRFQKASKNAKDPDVKAFADKMIPAIEHHLKMARDLKVETDKMAGKKG